ncbi:hypothetical protein CerSpe_216840 [Prunus speciosa]
MSTLMRNNSGFGWDPIAKTFIASDEVWKDYLKSHPSHSKLREKSVVDYEDLKIVIGGGTATGNGSIALGADDTDATTYGEENRDFGMEDFLYDPNNDAFIAPNHYEPSYQPPSPYQCSPPSHSPLGSEVPTKKPSRNKRSRSEYEGSSSLVGTNNQAKVLENLSIGIETISANFEKISNLMEKRERERDRERDIWDAIKEIPNLDDNTCFMAGELLSNKAKKDLFLKMSLAERSSWIKFKLG